MGMSFDKCYSCEFNISLPTGCGLIIICKVTGDEIEINECPMGD